MSIAPEKLTPAYIPWETFTTFIGHLKALAVPTRIDKSAMPPNMPALTRGQVQSTLKFLKLIDADGNTSESLNALVVAYETDGWRDAVRKMLQGPYAEIVGDLEITLATPHQLDEKFTAVNVAGQMLQKSERFYLAALGAAGIPFSPHLAGRRKRSGVARKRASIVKTPAPKEAAPVETQGGSLSAAVDGQNVVGMKEFPLHFKGRPSGRLLVPSDLTVADCKMIELQLVVVKAYAEGGGESE